MNEIQRLHERAMAIVKRFKKCEIELIEILQEVGAKRVFYTLKFSSLFDYAVRGLGLSEEMAYIYIGVSRKAAEVPALAHEIRAGRVSVSKAKTICSVITRENQSHWLDLAKSSTKRQLEREVAIASPRNAVREKATYQSAPTEEQAKILQLAEVFVELKLGVPEALMLKLRQAQDLVSQGKRRHATLVETFEEMVDLFIEKKDPLEKAKRQKMRGRVVPGPVNVDGASSSAGTILPIPAAVKHQVYLRYQRQCGHIDQNGHRCPHRRLLEIHHIKPRCEGGTNDVENLILLCQGHHRIEHRTG